MRFTPSAALAISARMSPMFCSGKRELRKKIFSVPSLVTPASISLVGGTMMPSWKMSVVSGLIDPARRPPMSEKCAQPMTKPQRRPSWNTGARSTWSLECDMAPREP
jgi:hypothetical protein